MLQGGNEGSDRLLWARAAGGLRALGTAEPPMVSLRPASLILCHHEQVTSLLWPLASL